MTSIKEDPEEIIAKIKKTIEAKYSKQFSDKEILKKCLEYSRAHINDLIKEGQREVEPNSEKIKRILSNAQNYQLYSLNKSDDELIYGISKN
ncbi:MAG: hypothetical protein R6U96_10470 [Promethearchaeia archaeon]